MSTKKTRKKSDLLLNLLLFKDNGMIIYQLLLLRNNSLFTWLQRQAWKFGEGVDKNLAAESEEREQDRKKASKNTKQGYLSCWKHETKTLESPVIPACVLCRSFESCFHSTGLLCPDNFAWSSIVFHSVCCSASLETMHKTLYEIQLI